MDLDLARPGSGRRAHPSALLLAAAVIVLVSTLPLVASSLVTRAQHGLGALVVLAVGLSVAGFLAYRSAASANALHAAVTEALETTDTVLWESPGDTLVPTTIFGPIERLYGWTVEQHLEPGMWPSLVHPDDAGIIESTEHAAAAGEPHRIQYRLRTRGGEYRWLDEHVNVVKNDRGQVTGRRGLARDITDAVHAQALADRYVQFIDSLPLGALIVEVVDPDDPTSLVIRAANAAMDHFSPRPMDSAVGQRLADARPDLFDDGLPGAQVSMVIRSVREQRPAFVDSIEVTGLAPGPMRVAMWITPLPGNHAAVLAEDMTEIVEARRLLEDLAYRDALTKLPNRTALHLALAGMLHDADLSGGGVTLAVIDLDQFKEVNDAFGHGLGDELLIAVADALTRCVPAGATIARLGGDEFAVIAPVEARDAARLGDLLRGAFERPLKLNSGLTLQASISVGLATYPDQAESAEMLLQRADVAMYTAKRQSFGTAVYAPEADRSSARRVTLLGDLRRAIDDGELTLHYQPIVDTASGMVRRVEGLIRWEHPELGLLLPAEFIELTELNNLNRGVVLTVVRQGLETLSRWHRSGAPVGLSVNVGGHSLADSELIGEIVDLVRAARLPALSFGIELTERQLLLETQTSMSSFRRLAESGIWLSIDDFGTGSSSLWALREIPAHELKIDRSFVEDLRRGEGALLRSIVAMSHDLGLEVVAEGVEDEVTYQWLRDAGCDHAQGYLFAAPMPSWQVELMFEAPCRPRAVRRGAGHTP